MTDPKSQPHPLDDDGSSMARTSEDCKPVARFLNSIHRLSIILLIVGFTVAIVAGVATANAQPESALAGTGAAVNQLGTFAMLCGFCGILLAYRLSTLKALSLPSTPCRQIKLISFHPGMRITTELFESKVTGWIDELGGEILENGTFVLLSGTSVSGVSPIAQLTKLERLGLANTAVNDVAPLANLRNLQWLDLKHTPVTDLSPLAKLPLLRVLELQNTPASDLSPLAKATSLAVLLLNETPVHDLSPLAHLTNLVMLDLSGTQVADLSPLGSATELKSLYLRDIRATALSPLANLKNLELLVLDHTRATDLMSLSKLTNLTTLEIQGAPVTDEEVAKLEKALPQCRIGR